MKFKVGIMCLTHKVHENDIIMNVVKIVFFFNSADIPEQPQSLMAQNVTSRNLTLTWVEPNNNNAPITSYRVHYTQPAFLGGKNVFIVTDSKRVLISSLHPGESYNFTVVAVNDIGVSEISKPWTQQMKEERKLLVLKWQSLTVSLSAITVAFMYMYSSITTHNDQSHSQIYVSDNRMG